MARGKRRILGLALAAVAFVAALAAAAGVAKLVYRQKLYASLPPLPAPRLSEIPEESRAQVDAALKEAQAGPYDAGAAGRLGMVLQAYRQVQGAEAAYDRASRLAPGVFEWHYYLGYVRARQGKFEAALAPFQAALRTAPQEFTVMVALGEALIDARKLNEAKKIYESALQLNPRQPQALFGLGRTLMEQEQWQAALDPLHQATGIFPRYGRANYLLSQIYRRLGDPTRAETHLQMYSAAPKAVPPLENPWISRVTRLDISTQGYVVRGRNLAAEGRPQLAIRELELALMRDPRHQGARVNLIGLYARMGRPKPAEKHYQEAVNLGIDTPELHYAHALLLLAREEPGEAAVELRRVVELNPQSVEAQTELARVFGMRGKRKEAEREFRKALDLRPAYAPAHAGFGLLLASEKKYPPAIEHLENARKGGGPLPPRLLFELARCYRATGDSEKADTLFRQAQASASLLGKAGLAGRIEDELNERP